MCVIIVHRIIFNVLFSRLKSDRKRQEKLALARLAERKRERNQAKQTGVIQEDLEDVNEPSKLQVCVAYT